VSEIPGLHPKSSPQFRNVASVTGTLKAISFGAALERVDGEDGTFEITFMVRDGAVN
jgi:hypothetical protein